MKKYIVLFILLLHLFFCCIYSFVAFILMLIDLDSFEYFRSQLSECSRNLDECRLKAYEFALNCIEEGDLFICLNEHGWKKSKMVEFRDACKYFGDEDLTETYDLIIKNITSVNDEEKPAALLEKYLNEKAADTALLSRSKKRILEYYYKNVESWGEKSSYSNQKYQIEFRHSIRLYYEWLNSLMPNVMSKFYESKGWQYIEESGDIRRGFAIGIKEDNKHTTSLLAIDMKNGETDIETHVILEKLDGFNLCSILSHKYFKNNEEVWDKDVQNIITQELKKVFNSEDYFE